MEITIKLYYLRLNQLLCYYVMIINFLILIILIIIVASCII